MESKILLYKGKWLCMKHWAWGWVEILEPWPHTASNIHHFLALPFVWLLPTHCFISVLLAMLHKHKVVDCVSCELTKL